MRKVLTLSSVACLLLFVVSCGMSPELKIVGKWTEPKMHAAVATTYIFNSDGTAKILMGDRVTAGSLIWELDASQNPIHLDLINTADTGPKIIFMIVQFEDQNKIILSESGNPSTRPISIEETQPSGNWTLERVVD